MRLEIPMHHRLALALSALLIAVVPAAGHADVLQLDPESTTITFTLGATLHSVHGTAHLTGAVMTFDPATGMASGEVVVDATSADTDSEGRDEKMHKDVLRTASYPTIVFRLQSFAGHVPDTGEAEIEVTGEMVLLGTSHPVTWPVMLRRNADKLEIELAFSVPYVEWGLKDPSKFVLRVDKEVTVEVTSAGTIRQDPIVN